MLIQVYKYIYIYIYIPESSGSSRSVGVFEEAPRRGYRGRESEGGGETSTHSAGSAASIHILGPFMELLALLGLLLGTFWACYFFICFAGASWRAFWRILGAFGRHFSDFGLPFSGSVGLVILLTPLVRNHTF